MALAKHGDGAGTAHAAHPQGTAASAGYDGNHAAGVAKVGAAAMALSSVSVIGNALRLARVKLD